MFLKPRQEIDYDEATPETTSIDYTREELRCTYTATDQTE